MVSLGEVTQLPHRAGWKASRGLWMRKPAGRKGGHGPPALATLGFLTQWERLGSSW